MGSNQALITDGEGPLSDSESSRAMSAAGSSRAIFWILIPAQCQLYIISINNKYRREIILSFEPEQLLVVLERVIQAFHRFDHIIPILDIAVIKTGYD